MIETHKGMQIGMVFPQAGIGPDPGAVKAIAQTAESLGYSHLLAYDHVLGANVRKRPDFRGPYTSDSLFHEVFVLFGFPAAIGMEARIRLDRIPRDTWGAVTEAWRALGATHLSVITADERRDGSGHIRLLREYAETVDLSPPHATD